MIRLRLNRDTRLSIKLILICKKLLHCQKWSLLNVFRAEGPRFGRIDPTAIFLVYGAGRRGFLLWLGKNKLWTNYQSSREAKQSRAVGLCVVGVGGFVVDGGSWFDSSGGFSRGVCINPAKQGKLRGKSK